MNNIPNRRYANSPTIPLPNPGEGGPVAPLPGDENIPVTPLPNPEENSPVAPLPGDENIPVIPLPNPGEGGPVAPLPNPGDGNIIIPIWPRNAKVRFINAAFGYQSFRIFINNRRVVNLLNFASISSYDKVSAGYQTITVTGRNGYVYLQKSIPFQARSASTVAIVNRAGGLDLIQIADNCCPPENGYSNFRVSNLAYNSGPLDVLLGDGRVIYADIRFKETTTYKRIQPGQYQFLFAETNLLPIPNNMDIESLDSAFIGMYPVPNTVASLYLNVQGNTNITVFLLSSGTDSNAIQTIVSEDQ